MEKNKSTIANHPAFETDPTRSDGLTKREYFAAHAPNEVLQDDGSSREAAEKELGLERGTYCIQEHYPILVAKRAVRYADALITALNDKADT